jgi:ectoine hydroxylase-related dioxygenase (phytanoyl-CoA dioxygenase family)
VLTLGVPLVDLTPETGTTAMYPGTHRALMRPDEVAPDDAAHPLIPLGGAYLMDYRLIHGGTPNASPRARPLLYLVYARPWWLDVTNYLTDNLPALVVDDETLARVPPALGHLLARARAASLVRVRLP